MNMNITDLRKSCRRTLGRRLSERRSVGYKFGSSEWVEHIKQNYHAWPKTDRRCSDRRSDDRRASQRRGLQYSKYGRSEEQYSRVLLTNEERKLFEDLFLEDFD